MLSQNEEKELESVWNKVKKANGKQYGDILLPNKTLWQDSNHTKSDTTQNTTAKT